MELVNDFFKSLYRLGKYSCIRRPELKEGIIKVLSALISNREVWRALKCLKPYKASSLDCWHPVFFFKNSGTSLGAL